MVRATAAKAKAGKAKPVPSGRVKLALGGRVKLALGGRFPLRPGADDERPWPVPFVRPPTFKGRQHWKENTHPATSSWPQLDKLCPRRGSWSWRAPTQVGSHGNLTMAT